jgi:serine/threonine protein kinase
MEANSNIYMAWDGKYLEEFTEVKEIGSGSFGSVVSAINKFDQQIYAIKKIEINKDLPIDITRTLDEVKFFKNLKSECIVHYQDAWVEDNHKSVFEDSLIFYIQMELCDKTLEDIIRLNDRLFPSMNRMRFFVSCKLFKEILKGVEYLHEKYIIHRDLKPSNIFITREESMNFVKIGDIGFATLHNYSEHSHTMDKDTVKYMAPEVMVNKKYDMKCDIYSLGIICLELFNSDLNKLSFKNFYVIILIENFIYTY